MSGLALHDQSCRRPFATLEPISGDHQNLTWHSAQVLLWKTFARFVESYDHNITPLQIIQRKAIRLITFSNFDAHTSPLLAKLNLFKLQDHY